MAEDSQLGSTVERSIAPHHERTRSRGVRWPLYVPVRVILQAPIHIYFRLRRLGREHIPGGAVILGANHRSLLDPTGVESLATMPLLGRAFERWGIDAPVTTGLQQLLDGETSADQWLESLRTDAPLRSPRAA